MMRKNAGQFINGQPVDSTVHGHFGKKHEEILNGELMSTGQMEEVFIDLSYRESYTQCVPDNSFHIQPLIERLYI
jgi:hypothetical protein